MGKKSNGHNNNGNSAKLSIHLKRKRDRERKKLYIIDFKKAHPCQKCGETDAICLTFHHRNPDEKRFTVHTGAARRYSLESIRTEMKKCDILCLNCHSKLHNGLGNLKKPSDHK